MEYESSFSMVPVRCSCLQVIGHLQGRYETLISQRYTPEEALDLLGLSQYKAAYISYMIRYIPKDFFEKEPYRSQEGLYNQIISQGGTPEQFLDFLGTIPRDSYKFIIQYRFTPRQIMDIIGLQKYKDAFLKLIKYTPEEALDELGVKKYCCRKEFICPQIIQFGQSIEAQERLGLTTMCSNLSTLNISRSNTTNIPAPIIGIRQGTTPISLPKPTISRPSNPNISELTYNASLVSIPLVPPQPVLPPQVITQPQRLTPNTQVLLPQPQRLTPNTQVLLPQPQRLTPNTQVLLPQPQRLTPNTQVLPPMTQSGAPASSLQPLPRVRRLNRPGSIIVPSMQQPPM
jgi:DNA-directed RNA polymerase subunit N (RpoN/RPB10)